MDIRKFIVNRDYARRLYVPRDKRRRLYGVQMRKITDKQIDNQARYPHSESKKPYRDEEYPLMEYEWSPFEWWWPVWPTWPDIPPISNLPDHPGSFVGDNPDKPPREGGIFLGCEFYWPLTPGTIEPGETAYAKLMRRDDPIVAWAVQGPIKIIQENAINCHSNFNGGPSSPECTVIVQALEDTTGYGADANGCALGVIIAYTASGESCSTSVCVKLCPADPPFAYDWDASDETAGASDTATVCVTGGRAPYSWSVSGTDVSLAAATTTGLCNTLNTGASFCGTAVITVTDACGDEVEGSVKYTGAGSWSTLCLGQEECWFLCGAPTTGWSCVGVRRFQAQKVQGGFRQTDTMQSGAFFGSGLPDCQTYIRDWTGPECLTRPSAIPTGCQADPNADAGFCSGGYAFQYDVQINPVYYWQQGVNQCCHSRWGVPVNGARYEKWIC